MLNNNINKNTLISLGGNIYLNYNNIICLLEPKEIINKKWFKTKKVVNSKENISSVKSYIYCKNDFLIATSIDINSLKDKIANIINNNYDCNNNIFQNKNL